MHKRSSLTKSSTTILDELAITLAIAKYQLKRIIRHRSNVIGLIAYPLSFIVFGLTLSGIIDRSSFDVAAGGGVSITVYILIGTAIYNFFEMGMKMSNIFELEQAYGTLEPNLLSHGKRSSYVCGLFLGRLLWYFLGSLLMLLVAIPLTAQQLIFSWNLLILVLCVLSLVIVASLGLGFFLAGLEVVYKQISSIASVISIVLLFFSGVIIPIKSMPLVLQFVSYFVPLTWSLDLFRSVFLGLTPLMPIVYEVLILFSSSLFFLMSGYCLYRYAYTRIKKLGLTGLY